MSRSTRPPTSAWKSWVIPDRNAALEDQSLQTLSTLAGLLSTLVVVPVNSIQNLSPWVNRSIFLFGLVCFYIAASARAGRYRRKTFVWALVGVLNVLWFLNGGTYGSVGLYFFAVALFMVVFFEGALRRASLVLLVVNILLLLETERRFPALLIHFGTSTDRLIDLFTGYVISLSMCAMITWVIVAGFNRERSRAKAAMAAVEQRETVLRVMFESSRDGICVAVGDVVEFVNPAFVAMFEYDSRQVVLGLQLSQLMEPIAPGGSLPWNAPRESATGTNGDGESEAIGKRRGGARFPASLRLSSYMLEGVTREVIRVTDLTERKRAEEQRRQFEAQARHNEKMESLGSLAGGVAHDMNNVLSVVLGLASVHHAEASPGSNLSNDMETIVRACQRGGTMVKSLLEFSRESVEQKRKFDLNRVVRQVVEKLENSIPHDIRVSVELDTKLMAVRGDPVMLSHALANVCSNAVDAMPAGGTLSIRTANHDGETVLVQVGDSGFGMSKEVLERALEPFYTTKPMGKGSGLGLPMVFGAVKAHRGKLEIQSTPGEGTDVQIRLPVDHSRSTLRRDAPELRSIPPVKVLKILLVDDDELVQHAVHRILRTMGHTVTTVSGGVSALAVVEAGYRPDLVILDMNMPEMDGAATLPRLREMLPAVPVVLATGRVDDAATDLVASFPNVTLLPKPFNAGELGRSVEAVSSGLRSAR